MKSSSFDRLYQPLQLKGVRLRNRIVKPPQVLGFAAADGNASDKPIGHCEALAPHAQGCPPFLQLSHNGPAAQYEGGPPPAASTFTRREAPRPPEPDTALADALHAAASEVHAIGPDDPGLILHAIARGWRAGQAV